jgi:multiple sugar transport system ATP-binding protein
MTMADKIVVMHAGKVEQIGAPLDLYDNPANLFVAGFIGSPAMNFLGGKVARNGSGLEVVLGDGVRVPAPRSLRADSEGMQVTLGVRPEHLAVRDSGVPAEVIVVEPTGANTEIYCKLAGKEVTAVVRERHNFHPGETIRLAPEITFLFDPVTGARIQ